MTVFSIVFIHLEDKRIFLWMDKVEGEADALLRAQQEFERMGIDPAKLGVVAIKGLETQEIILTQKIEVISKEIEEYEKWKKEGELGGRAAETHEGSGKAKQAEGHARGAKREGRGARGRSVKKYS